MTLLLVLVGGAVGALTRYLTDRALQSSPEVALPWGTLTVNVVGSLVLGALAGWGTQLPGWVGPLVGAGFCGALTTYSTFGIESVRMARSGARAYLAVYVAATIAGGLGGAAAGWALGNALAG